jgi:hypothetical protein
VYPYLPCALDYLTRTQEGEQWIANLIRHLHGARNGTTLRIGGEAVLPRSLDELHARLPQLAPGKPQIAVSNE